MFTSLPSAARFGAVAGFSLLASGAIRAQVADQAGANLPTIVVTAQHLNEERSRIDTQTGASTYTFSAQDIQASPGGDNVQLNQVMLQVPDAAQDSFGQLHIRGDHNGLQFRLNGVILPDGISVFGQTLPPRMIDQFKLITGSLPAEYGLRTAGIIDRYGPLRAAPCNRAGRSRCTAGATTRSNRASTMEAAAVTTLTLSLLTSSATISASSLRTEAQLRCMITRSRATDLDTSSTSLTRATASP
jgi:hypothetical protein